MQSNQRKNGMMNTVNTEDHKNIHITVCYKDISVMSNHHCNDKNIAHCQSQYNFSFELSYTLFKLLIRIDNLHPTDIF